MLVVLLLGGGGCGGDDEQPADPAEPQAAEEEPTTTPLATLPTIVRPIEPACRPKVVDGAVTLEDDEIGLTVPDARSLAVFPLDTERILLAVKANYTEASAAPPDGQLWVVACGAPHEREAFESLEGADFGHAELSKDREVLYFTGPKGVAALDLTSREVTPITEVLDVDDGCWWIGDEAFLGRRRDVVRGADGGTLLIERGAPCGFAGAWVGQEWTLPLPDEPAKTAPQPPARRVASVAVDRGGRLWLGDAGRCSEPGVRDPQTPGVVWLSRDDGDSWKRERVDADGTPMHTAAALILADSRRDGHVLVLSQRCDTLGGSYGGRIYVTRDAGVSWSQVDVPEHVGVESDGGYSVTAVKLLGGSVDRFVVWGAGGKRYKTLSSGRNWAAYDGDATPPAPVRELAVGKKTFQVSDSELRRVARDGSARVVFPMPGMPAFEPTDLQADAKRRGAN